MIEAAPLPAGYRVRGFLACTARRMAFATALVGDDVLSDSSTRSRNAAKAVACCAYEVPPDASRSLSRAIPFHSVLIGPGSMSTTSIP